MKSVKTPKDFPTREAYDAWAQAEWLAGRYCIGCQAVGVKTDGTSHCAQCSAFYEQQWHAAQPRQEQKDHD